MDFHPCRLLMPDAFFIVLSRISRFLWISPNLMLVIVILVLSTMTLILRLASFWKMQRALQWWQSRQENQLHQAAEEIRNGLLQKSFSLRRNLEVAQNSSMVSDRSETIGAHTPSQTWLNTLEDLNHDLKTLSDRLSPLYLGDSLPLALHARADQWRVVYPNCQFTLDLPTEWLPETYEWSQVLIVALDELFHLILSPSIPKLSVALCLNLEPEMGDLSVQIRETEAQLETQLEVQSTDLKFVPQEQLSYIALAFAALTAGRCRYQQTQNYLSSNFRWKLSPKHPLK